MNIEKLKSGYWRLTFSPPFIFFLAVGDSYKPHFSLCLAAEVSIVNYALPNYCLSGRVAGQK